MSLKVTIQKKMIGLKIKYQKGIVNFQDRKENICYYYPQLH